MKNPEYKPTTKVWNNSKDIEEKLDLSKYDCIFHVPEQIEVVHEISMILEKLLEERKKYKKLKYLK